MPDQMHIYNNPIISSAVNRNQTTGISDKASYRGNNLDPGILARVAQVVYSTLVLLAFWFAVPMGYIPLAHAQSNETSNETSNEIGELSSAALLRGLPASVTDHIKTVCLPSQFSEGASGFRQCVLNEVERYRISSSKKFESLSLDDKYAIQASCKPLLQTDREGYSQCLESELKKLTKIPEPNISSYSEDEQYALRQSCFEAQSQESATDYRKCLNRELKALNEIQPVSMAGLSSVEKNQLQLGCSPANQVQTAADYRLCLAQSLEQLLKQKKNVRLAEADQTGPIEIIGKIEIPGSRSAPKVVQTEEPIVAADTEQELSVPTTTTAIPASDEPDTAVSSTTVVKRATNNTELTTPTLKTRVITLPQETLIEDSPTGNSAPVQVTTVRKDNLVNNPTATNTLNANTAEDSDGSKLTSSNLPEFLNKPIILNYGKYLALLLPLLLLWALWRLISMVWPAGNTDQYEDNFHNTDQTEGAAEADREIYVNEQQRVNDQLQAASMSSDTIRPGTGQGVTSRDWNATDDADDTQEIPAESAAQHVAIEATSATSEFGQWLNNHSTLDQKRYCTEFILYWISYGEDKIDPEIKQELLTAKSLGDHDQIKKWVLLKDDKALIDALKTMRKLFDGKELEQTILLLFAVLIEHSISPLQNLFLRFFADFAGIGANSLGIMYQESFGVPLPPMSRPDDIRWWDKRSALEDPPSSTTLSDRSAMLAKLGLQDPVSELDISKALQFIAIRFAPERFNLLGEKEQRLVKRHYDKYVKAYQYLLGESV